MLHNTQGCQKMQYGVNRTKKTAYCVRQLFNRAKSLDTGKTTERISPDYNSESFKEGPVDKFAREFRF